MENMHTDHRVNEFMIRDTGKLNFKRKQWLISRITVYSLENNFFET